MQTTRLVRCQTQYYPVPEEMMEATNNFSRKIGQGGFGSVFFGKLHEGTEIAVKVLTFFSQQGVHQFQNEANYSNSAPLLLSYCIGNGLTLVIIILTIV